MVKGNKSKIDNLGRVVIPKSIRNALNVEHNDEISMHVENQSLIITKNNNSCSICPEEKIEMQIKDKYLCKSCVQAIKDF
jgi:transcriptional pleiotropic regulator of transition state genes